MPISSSVDFDNLSEAQCHQIIQILQAKVEAPVTTTAT